MPIKKIAKIRRKPDSKRDVNRYYAQIDWGKAKTIFEKPLVKPTSSSSYPSGRDILTILAKVGAIGLIFAFPGAASAIGSLVLGDKTYDRWRTKNIVSRLAKSKLIDIKYKDDGTVIAVITQKGMVRALSYKLETMQLIKPKYWDKKWRVVIFDIPEKLKSSREIFRMRLQQLGLYKLQDSVYVLPYKCFDEIEFLRQIYSIPDTVLYLLVDKLEGDDFLKNHFDLT